MRIKFKTENAAFEEGLIYDESARILRAIAERIEQGEDHGNCIDINGNRVGEWTF